MPRSSPVGPELQLSSGGNFIFTTTAAASDPTDPQVILGGAHQTVGPPSFNAAFATRDRGASWSAAAPPAPANMPDASLYGPSLAFDARGDAYEAFGAQTFDSTGLTGSEVAVARSTDKGLHWNHPAIVGSPNDFGELPKLAVDQTTGKAYSHPNRIYVAYDIAPAQYQNPAVIAYSDNGGLSWSNPVSIFDSGGDFGVVPAVAPDGTVYVAWNDWCYPFVQTTCWDRALNLPSALTGRILVAKSTDGGVTFQPFTVVAGVTSGLGARPTNYGKACRSSASISPLPSVAVDPSSGNLYIAWSDWRAASQLGSWFSRSTDKGASWSSPIVLDYTGNDSWEPALAVDPSNGILSASWYDRRDDPNNKLYRLYYRESTDGGVNFTPPIGVSSVPSDPTLSCTGTGDYLQMTSARGSAHLFWTDTRTGMNQIFTAAVDESAVISIPLMPPPPIFHGPLSMPASLLGDFRGNGKLDVAAFTGYPGKNVSVYLGNGDGTFGQTPIVTPIAQAGQPNGDNIYSAVTGDFNGDGKLDIAFIGMKSTVYQTGEQLMDIAILLGDGAGRFQYLGPGPDAGNFAIGPLAVGDFNGDGHLDLALASPSDTTPGATPSRLLLFFGDGTGHFTTTGYPLQAAGHAVHLAAGDLKGDGKRRDLVTADRDAGTVTAWINSRDATGSFAAQPSFAVPKVDGLAIGDLNGDTKGDLVLQNDATSILIYLGNGDGTFAAKAAYNETGNVSSVPDGIAIGDVDLDGKPDVVYNGVVWLGNGDGTFRLGQDLGVIESWPQIADVNRDGRPDLVIQPYGAPSELFIGQLPPPPGAVAFSGTSLSYGSDSVGGPAVSRSVTLTSTGGVPVRIGLASITGAADLDYTITADTCSNTTLAAAVPTSGGTTSCVLTAAFLPSEAGTRAAALAIPNNGPSAPQSVSLSGTGGSPATSVAVATDSHQFQLLGSDGSTWTDIDTTNLSQSITPAAAGKAIIRGNVDLWTANAGVNQDVGIWVTGGAFGSGQVVAWKESGGFAGTFSPNAALVQAVIDVQPDTTYRARLVWKTNRSASATTIYAGAGAGSEFSPTRLTVQLVSASSNVSTAQSSLSGSNGSSWQDLSAGPAPITIAGTGGPVMLTANADLWTASAGLNQDLGLWVGGGAYGGGRIVAWKESGGFAGTFSPNAAFVEAVIDTQMGNPYTVKLVWKTNKSAPAGAAIYAGAGPINGQFSGTSVTAIPLSAANVRSAAGGGQFHLTGSGGSNWTAIGVALAPFVAPANGTLLLGGNADLWTANVGYNQDLAIFVSVDGGPAQLVSWKESGGYAGTFSPNAAFVEAAITVTASHSYTVSLFWKTNRLDPGTIYAGAGPLNGQYSPTTLTADFIP